MKRNIAIIMVLALITGLLSACAQSMNAPAMSGNSDSGRYEYNSSGNTNFLSDMDTETVYDLAIEYGNPSESLPGPQTNLPNSGNADNMSEKIIYSAIADIETISFDETIDMVYDMLLFNNGFVESSYVGGKNYAQTYTKAQTYRTANFTLRIPKDRFMTVTSGLNELGHVTSLRSNSENITMQFVDTESRLASYRVQEERLLAMLAKADEISDMLTIESNLSTVRYNIESLTSNLKNWQSKVDYSTLTIFIKEVEEYTDIESDEIEQTYWVEIVEGFKTTGKSVAAFFANAFKWMIIYLPIIAIISIITIIAVFLGRRFVKTSKRKKAISEAVENTEENTQNEDEL